ncbi:MAG: hypothetical protein U1E17_06090 [Geminicoccaceae bacterium]
MLYRLPTTAPTRRPTCPRAWPRRPGPGTSSIYEATIQSRDQQTTTALSVSGLSVKVDFTASTPPTRP